MKLALRLAAVAVIAALAWLAIAKFQSAPDAAAIEKPSNAKEAPATLAHGAVETPSSEATDLPAEAPSARAPAAAPEPAAAPRLDAVTLLRVHVVAKETRKPLEGKLVGAHPSDAKSWKTGEARSGRVGVGERTITDRDGRGEIEVEPGHELRIDVFDTDRPDVVVAALSPGEQRDVEVELRTEDDISLHGRLVDAETGRGLAEGVVWLEARNRSGLTRPGSPSNGPGGEHSVSDEIHVDPDGRFVLKGRSWEQRFASAKSNGYARTVFALRAGHDAPERALEVRLSRAAALEVTVLDGQRAVQDAAVVLTTESYRVQQDEGMLHFYMDADPTWSSRTDAGGVAVVGELPPNVPLQLSVSVKGRSPRKQGEPITLQPGEQRSLEIRLGSGAAIVGRIEDSTGAPIAGCTLWRTPSDGAEPGRLLESYRKPAATARSDEAGNFRFDDVAAGTWLVGPQPAQNRDPDASDRTAYPPLAQAVRVEEGSGVVEVVVRVDRGLYLTGTVLDPQGAPSKAVGVLARGESVGGFFQGRTNASGQFTLGPMPAGSYLVQAGGFMRAGGHAASADVRASAGDVGLVVQLRPGGAIRGRVVDAAGKPRECTLSLSPEDQGIGGLRTATRDGLLKFEGLLAGPYTVSATTSDGLSGRRSGVVVRAGETAEVEVLLEPGAKLKVRYEGPADGVYFAVLLDGITVTSDNPERSKPTVVVVPAGSLEVRWYEKYPEIAHSERFEIAAGGEREVVWDGK